MDDRFHYESLEDEQAKEDYPSWDCYQTQMPKEEYDALLDALEESEKHLADRNNAREII